MSNGRRGRPEKNNRDVGLGLDASIAISGLASRMQIDWH